MSLSTDIVSRFVKATKDEQIKDTGSIAYGTVVKYNNQYYVRLDGSGLLTPAITTVKRETDERVVVSIKNHTAVITGNITSPSASDNDMQVVIKDSTDVGKYITELQVLVANKVDTDIFTAEQAKIEELYTNKLDIDEFIAEQGRVDTLFTHKLDTEVFTSEKAQLTSLIGEKIDAEFVEARYATIQDLEAVELDVYTLESTYGDFASLTATKFETIEADIRSLEVDKITADDIEGKFANIDFSNIGSAAIEHLYSTSGLIENVVISDGSITGTLVGVTIKGDILEAGTVVADKLVIQGEDGLYYKLNTDGVTTEAEQTEYNSLNGSIITAKSITAAQISVDDLVAFGATIGGFHITTDAIFSGVKESVDNSTNGTYLDNIGQFSLGDAENYIRYYKDENDIWRLEISAESILFGNDSKSSADDIRALTEHVKIGTFTDPDTGDILPCVELSEGDSDFKQIITNSSTIFKDGSVEKTKIDTHGVTTENITVKDEFRQGEFVWKARSNGNLGLMWRGGTA